MTSDNQRNPYPIAFLLLALLGMMLLAWAVPIIHKQEPFYLELSPRSPGKAGYELAPQTGYELTFEQVPAQVTRLIVEVRLQENRGTDLAVSSARGPVDSHLAKPSRITFRLQRRGSSFAKVFLFNKSASPLNLKHIVLKDFSGINSKPPRLVLALERPAEKSGIAWWLLLLGLGLALVSARLSIKAGWWTGWPAAGILAGPWLGLGAFGLIRLAGGWLVFYWETMALLLCLGPAALAYAALWKIASSRSPLKLKTLKIATLAAVLAAMVFLVYQGERNRMGGPGVISLLHLGQQFTVNKTYLPEGFQAQEKIGYDGQFFYYMAQDPLATGQAYQNLDSPSYRYQRPLYPGLLFLLTGGDKHLLPSAAIWLNVICIAGSLVVLIILTSNFQADWWKLLFIIGNYGLFLSAFYGLAEPLCDLLLLTSLLLLTRKRYGWCCLTMCLMILCKEYYVVAPLAVMAHAALRKRFGRMALFVVPVLAGALWQYYVYLRFQVPSWEQSHGNFQWFFTGLFGMLLGDTMPDARLVILGILASVVLAMVLFCKKPMDLLVWIWGGFLLINLTGGANRLEVALVRIFSPAYMCYMAVLLRERGKVILVPGILLFAYSLLKLNFYN